MTGISHIPHRLATSLFPEVPRQTLSTARNLCAGSKQTEVGKYTCWVHNAMNINELVCIGGGQDFDHYNTLGFC